MDKDKKQSFEEWDASVKARGLTGYQGLQELAREREAIEAALAEEQSKLRRRQSN